MRKTALLILTLLFTTTAAYADHYGDTYVIPIVGHVRGANGTLWMSDVTIRNFSNTPMTVELVFIESGSNTADNIQPLITSEINGSVTVPVNSTVTLRDILRGYRLENVSGALLLGSDRPFAVTSRAYSNRSPLGQTVPAARNFFENSAGNIDNNAAVYITGIMQNAATRTNVGFVAGSLTTSMVVEVTIRNASGAVAGTTSIFIPEGSFAHYQFGIASFVNQTIDVGTAEFRVTSGEGTVVPYASLVDNATGDAAYIMGQFPDSTPPGSSSIFSTNSNSRKTSIFRQLLELRTP